MTEANEPRPYEEILPPRKSRRGWWTLGILGVVVLILGTCVKGGMDFYHAIEVRNEATRALAMEVLKSGMRDADDPIYAERGGFTQPMIEDMNETISFYGKASKFSESTCGMFTSANTDASQAGTFSNCYVTAQVPRSNVGVSVSWVREDKAWKVQGLNINYSNPEPLNELLALKAQEAQAEEEATPE